jgi:hypothetical protein
MKLVDLKPEAQATVKRVILELLAYKRRYRTSITNSS